MRPGCHEPAMWPHANVQEASILQAFLIIKFHSTLTLKSDLPHKVVTGKYPPRPVATKPYQLFTQVYQLFTQTCGNKALPTIHPNLWQQSLINYSPRPVATKPYQLFTQTSGTNALSNIHPDQWHQCLIKYSPRPVATKLYQLKYLNNSI